MGDKTGIEWTDATWNPVIGCDKVTDGCTNCYAERIAERFRGIPGHHYEDGFDLKLKEERLDQPLRWRKPRQIFVNSMSDLFHKDIPKDYIDKVFDVMEEADHHLYQILTKRSSLMRDYMKKRYASKLCPAHIWCGVSVEDAKNTARIRHLQQTPCQTRFLSAEPLLASIGTPDLSDIHWVIVGGESGPGARPMEKQWVIEIRELCKQQGVHFFFKQWGGRSAKANGRELDGQTYDAMPQWQSTKAVP